MSEHSVSEAGDQLSALIDRALAGEGVVITRQGRPVVELRPIEVVAREPEPVSDAEVRWLRTNRVGRVPPEDAGTFVSRMRDEDWR